MDSLIHNLDQLEDEDRINCERAIKALWNGDAETQNRISKLFKQKVSKKPSTRSKVRKNSSDPEKFFKKIGPDLRKAIREMKKEKVNNPRIVFKKKITPELKKAVKELKKKRIANKNAEKEAKKAEKEAKKAEKEAKKAEKEAKKAEREAKKAEREAKKAEKEAKKAEKEAKKDETFVDNEDSDTNDSDQDSSSADEEEALRRIKSARPDLTDDGARILLEKFKEKLRQ
jgi:membrane protein involved in colicin uptake